MAIQLRFAKLHLHEPQVVLNNILWTVETKVEMTGKSRAERQKKYRIKGLHNGPVQAQISTQLKYCGQSKKTSGHKSQ